MINTRVVEEEKKVYINVSGYITSRDAREFLNNYKQITRGIKSSQYKLVVTPSMFECENSDDIRTVCMALLKTGYKKMYLVDPNDYIMSTMSLGAMEKKLFFKSVNVVKNKADAR